MPQCQFLFSAVFGSRKAVRAIFSEFDETKAKPPIFSRDTRSQKGKPGGGPRPPNHMAARRGERVRQPMVWPTRDATDVAPSPIYSPRRENPKYIHHIPEELPERRRHRNLVSGVRRSCSGTLPGRGSAPGAISISSIAIFIAVAVSHDEDGVVLPRG